MNALGRGSRHADFLKVLCRLCGEKIRKNGGWAFMKYKNVLRRLGFDTAHEDPAIYPEFVCHTCYLRLRRGKAVKTFGDLTWKRHTDDGACPTCRKGEISQRGGRPRKKKLTGRPRLDPKVAEERRKNRISMPLPPPTVMTTRSRRKAQKSAEVPAAGPPKLRKLAPKGAQEVSNTQTSTAVFPVPVADTISGIQEQHPPIAENTTQTLRGTETPMVFPLQTLENSSCLTLQGAQPLSNNPLIQTFGPSLAPASYLIPGASGLQGLSCTILTQNPFQTGSGVQQVQNPMGLPLLQSPSVIPIIQSLQHPLQNPLMQTAGVFPSMLPLLQPSGLLCTVPAVQTSLNQPVLPTPTTETGERISSITSTTSASCSIAEPLETSANDLDDELSGDISVSPNPSPTPSSIDDPSETLPNAEVDQEPQELPRFVLPSTLEKTICIDAFQKHDAGIKCKNCHKMIPLVNVDQHKFKCVPPFLALSDHNYMFSEEKRKKLRKARELRKQLPSKNNMPEAEEAEPVYDLVLIKRSLLEKLEDVVNRK